MERRPETEGKAEKEDQMTAGWVDVVGSTVG